MGPGRGARVRPPPPHWSPRRQGYLGAVGWGDPIVLSSKACCRRHEVHVEVAVIVLGGSSPTSVNTAPRPSPWPPACAALPTARLVDAHTSPLIGEGGASCSWSPAGRGTRPRGSEAAFSALPSPTTSLARPLSPAQAPTFSNLRGSSGQPALQCPRASRSLSACPGSAREGVRGQPSAPISSTLLDPGASPWSLPSPRSLPLSGSP